MFKAIIYTDKNDKLKSVVIPSINWDKKYTQLFAKGVNYDQVVRLHDQEFDTELSALFVVKAEMDRLRAGCK